MMVELILVFIVQFIVQTYLIIMWYYSRCNY